MTNQTIETAQLLRELAEQKARVDEEAVLKTLQIEDARRLFHELRVYQIELEMQNEELRRTQHELEISRTRYFSLYDLAPVGYLTINDHGLILEANLSVSNMLGVMRKNLLNKQITKFIFHEDQDMFYLHRKKVFERNEVQDWEMRMLRSDGSPFWGRLLASPAFNGEYWITLTDISKRKRVEDSLKSTELKYSRLFESMTDAYCCVDMEGRVVDSNALFQKMIGYDQEELMSLTYVQLTPDKWHAFEADIIEHQVLARGYSDVYQKEYQRKDGTIINIELKTFLLKDDAGKPTGMWAIIRDITDRKLVEQELQRAKDAAEAANIAKSDFLATMSHEIRTPLGALLGNVEMLEGTPLSPQQLEYLRDCKSASQMLLQVINDVLDFSKIEAGKLELVNESFSVSSMSRQLMRMFSASADQKGLDLTLSLGDNLPQYIFGDQQRLRQIIANLINNAIKFTNQGTVSLSITCDQASTTVITDKSLLRIMVSDTGIGIPPDKLENIFDSFTQVENFNTRSAPGTGLGLTICRRLLVLMGGSITVSSKLGEGSAFTVILPVIEVPSQAQVQEQAQTQEKTPPRKILFADDDMRGRVVAQKLLQRRGYLVTAVENGAELLDALQKEKFEIVLTDISMPDMDGTEVARIIRSGERVGIDPNIPIIAMTAHAFSDYRERFLAAGINGYIAKPVNLEELSKQIEELCDR